MFGDRGEGDGKGGGQFGHGGLAQGEAGKDGTAGGVGEGAEGGVESGFGGGLEIVNHMV
jgi:hypothetical protein